MDDDFASMTMSSMIISCPFSPRFSSSSYVKVVVIISCHGSERVEGYTNGDWSNGVVWVMVEEERRPQRWLGKRRS